MTNVITLQELTHRRAVLSGWRANTQICLAKTNVAKYCIRPSERSSSYQLRVGHKGERGKKRITKLSQRCKMKRRHHNRL